MGQVTRRRRSPFLLFEVLCSLALLTLVLFPLVRSSAELHRARKAALHTIPNRLIEAKIVGKVKEKMYLQEIPFSVLESSAYHDTIYIQDRSYHIHVRCIRSIHKTSLHKKGLLLAIDVSSAGQSPNAYWCFVEGVTT